MDTRPLKCRWCSGFLQRKDPHKHGTQPQFCSDACRKQHRKAYCTRWNQSNRDVLARKRDRNREQVREWNRQFYYRHRERRKRLRLEQYHRDPALALQRAREYARRNPDLIRAIGRRSALARRARLLKAFIEAVDPKTVFERDAGICGICKKDVDPNSDWHVDHIIPLARGGTHAYDNVQLAHGTCNRRKGAHVA